MTALIEAELGERHRGGGEHCVHQRHQRDQQGCTRGTAYRPLSCTAADGRHVESSRDHWYQGTSTRRLWQSDPSARVTGSPASPIHRTSVRCDSAVGVSPVRTAGFPVRRPCSPRVPATASVRRSRHGRHLQPSEGPPCGATVRRGSRPRRGGRSLVRHSERRRWGSRRVAFGGDGSRCLARDGGGCAAVECLPGEPDGVRQGGPGERVRAGGVGRGSDEGSAQATARRRPAGVHSRLVYRRAGRSRPVAGRAMARVRSSAPERGQVSSMRMNGLHWR